MLRGILGDCWSYKLQRNPCNLVLLIWDPYNKLQHIVVNFWRIMDEEDASAQYITRMDTIGKLVNVFKLGRNDGLCS